MTGPENWRRCNAATEHQVKRRVHQRQLFNSIQIQNTRGIYAENVAWMCRCTYENLPICCLPCVCVWTVGKGMYLNSRAWRVNDFLIIIISLRTFRRCRYLVLVCTTVYVFTYFFLLGWFGMNNVPLPNFGIASQNSLWHWMSVCSCCDIRDSDDDSVDA